MRLFIDRTIDDRVEKGLAKKMKAIDNRGFLSKNEVAASKSGEEAHTETQTIVMSGGKITEVINTDERNNVKRQLFVSLAGMLLSLAQYSTSPFFHLTGERTRRRQGRQLRDGGRPTEE